MRKLRERWKAGRHPDPQPGLEFEQAVMAADAEHVADEVRPRVVVEDRIITRLSHLDHGFGNFAPAGWR